jgi:hypothetical protein
MLNKLTLLYPSISQDIFSIILENAQAFFLDYCNISEFPATGDSLLFRMCVEDINKLGAEGYSSESSGGNSVSYNSDYSDNIYKCLNKYKHIRTIE